MASKSLYPASTSHHRPPSAVYRANTVTRPSRMGKAVGFTLEPCTLLQTCARACDCNGSWERRMQGGTSCPGTAPGLDVAGMWNSITPRGRLRSPSSANGSAMSTWKAMASRRTTPRRLAVLSSALGTTTGPKPTLSTSCAYYRSQKKSSGTPSTSHPCSTWRHS